MAKVTLPSLKGAKLIDHLVQASEKASAVMPAMCSTTSIYDTARLLRSRDQ